MTQRPTGWRYLELSYDAADRSDIRLDGIPTTDGATLGSLMARLGHDGWELIESAPGTGIRQVLWFKQPNGVGGQPGAPEVVAPVADATRSRVVLVAIGPNRIDPYRRAQLISAITQLTGQSGWRAARIVDKAPRVVADDLSPAEADRIGAALEALGATVEVS
ncbi:MAG: ribosomal protein L7/L12 [Chloroflexi bacterium]|nr:ribosomal protein L7/L12 [Chloroflexota bacterium]